MNVLDFIATCDNFFESFQTTCQKTNKGYERVFAKAREYISDTSQVHSAKIYLKQKIVILFYQNKIDYAKYIHVIDAIGEAARTELDTEACTANNTDWVQLIKIIIENRHELYSFDSDEYIKRDNKVHTFAQSYLRLKNLGINFNESDNKFLISDDSFNLINNEIDKLCREYGGEELQQSLMERIGRTYNPTTGRFMEYRQVSMGTTEIHAAIPFGYLLAIASKYTGTKGGNNPVIFERLIILVTDIIIIFEIQPYSHFEPLFIEQENLIEFVTRNILYDNFVGIPQTKASYSSSLIQYLYGKYNDSKNKSYEVPIKDVIRVAVAIISIANTKKFTNATIKDIAKKTRMPETKILAAMDNLLSVPAGRVNSTLHFPPSSLDIDHYFKPAIKIGNNYKIFPKSIASLGCLNTVFASIAIPDGKWNNLADSELGHAIEDYLRTAFTRKGINIVFGERVDADTDLEIDLLCETEDSIYIFEMKKKILTRKAQSGDQATIFSDLADSVLASHFQAMRIENILKTKESIELINRNGKHTVVLNNRNVQRISISLSDFGALQDKTVLQRLLSIAISIEISHPDKRENKKLKNWNEISSKLKKLAIENGELNKNKIPFHNSLFMSIPQIIMILDNSKDSEDFFKHIRSFVTMTTGTRDTYTEFLNRLKFITALKTEDLPVHI